MAKISMGTFFQPCKIVQDRLKWTLILNRPKKAKMDSDHKQTKNVFKMQRWRLKMNSKVTQNRPKLYSKKTKMDSKKTKMDSNLTKRLFTDRPNIGSKLSQNE